MRTILLLVALSACRPNHVVLSIDDPYNLATDAEVLAVGFDRASLQPFARPPGNFPVSILVTVDAARGKRHVWVEARNGVGVALARGDTECGFNANIRDGVEVDLAGACESAGTDGSTCKRDNAGSPGICVAGACDVSRCGDGVLDETQGEECDDGNDSDFDACRTDCRPNTCGDGLLNPQAEGCDDGAHCSDGRSCTTDDECAGLGDPLCLPRNDDGCSTVCLGEDCGDGITQSTEECDDGNDDPNDGCSPLCRFEGCGDAIVQAGEICDDGNRDSYDGCRGDCLKIDLCGDGVTDGGPDAGQTWLGEECDDGNTDPNDLCHACERTRWTPELVFGLGAASGGPETVALPNLRGIDHDLEGNLVLAVFGLHQISRLDPGGAVSVVAGTGEPGFSGDGGPAAAAKIAGPTDIAVDGPGNIYFASYTNHTVRKVCAGDLECPAGHIVTVAGNGAPTSGTNPLGDGGPAIDATLNAPQGLAVDGRGNLFISDTNNHRVRHVCLDGVDCALGSIVTVAGDGSGAFGGDDGPGADAQLNIPRGIEVDDRGRLFIADRGNQRIRMVCAGDGDCPAGNITTVAGSGLAGLGCSSCAALSTRMWEPMEVAIDAYGNVYTSELYATMVRRICFDATTCTVGDIVRIAGTGSAGDSGDGGPATSARVYGVTGLTVDLAGDLFIADQLNNRLRTVCLSGLGCQVGNIYAVAGNGEASYPRETYNPLTIESRVSPVAIDRHGNLYSRFVGLNTVWRLCRNASTCTVGELDLIAGTGENGSTGDLGPAIEATLSSVSGIAVDGQDNIYIADATNNRIRKVCAVEDGPCVPGFIRTVAGTGEASSTGDAGPATDATLNRPYGLAVDPAGNLYLAEGIGGRVRRICVDGVGCTAGNIEAFAGGGASLDDDIPATDVYLNTVQTLTADAAGNIYFPDYWLGWFWKVCQDGDGCTPGNIYWIAGAGLGDSGDGGPAEDARFQWPDGICVDSAKNVILSDTNNHRMRRLCIDGVDCTSGYVYAYAGTGEQGALGDGGPALTAQLSLPGSCVTDADGNVYVADTDARRLRQICADGPGCAAGSITTLVGKVGMETDGEFSWAQLSAPDAMVRHGASPVLYVADGGSGRVRQIDLLAERVTSVVGYTGVVEPGHESSTLAFYSRLLRAPAGLALDTSGATDALFVAERGGHTIRRIEMVDPQEARTWTVADVAGTLDTPGFAGGVLSSALFDQPTGLAISPDGTTLFVADAGNHVVREIDLVGGSISTLAGRPRQLAFYGDDVPAIEAWMNGPRALKLCGSSLYVSDSGNNRVRRVDLTNGRIYTVLGNGGAASSGTGEPARDFPVDDPRGMVCDSRGNLFITSRYAIREVTAGDDGLATGDDPVTTLYGTSPRDTFPESVTRCLSGLVVDPRVSDDETLLVIDGCQGYLIRLDRNAIGG